MILFVLVFVSLGQSERFFFFKLIVRRDTKQKKVFFKLLIRSEMGFFCHILAPHLPISSIRALMVKLNIYWRQAKVRHEKVRNFNNLLMEINKTINERERGTDNQRQCMKESASHHRFVVKTFVTLVKVKHKIHCTRNFGKRKYSK